MPHVIAFKVMIRASIVTSNFIKICIFLKLLLIVINIYLFRKKVQLHYYQINDLLITCVIMGQGVVCQSV